MKLVNMLLAAMLPLSFIACHHQESSKAGLVANEVQLPEIKNDDKQLLQSVADTTGTPSGNATPRINKANGSTQEDWDKKIIKTANVSVEVKDYNNFNKLVHDNIKRTGGYIAQEEQNQSDYRVENKMVIKVPVDQFDEAITLLTPAAEKLIEKKIVSEDVTAEMVDVKARMDAKKKIRDRYLDLLKQAKNMSEVLEVQNEVNGIQENIEAAAGRINYLGHAAAFSTININFYQVVSAAPGNESSPGFLLRLTNSFKEGLQWLAELFVLLVSLWPLWLAVAIAWIFFRKWRMAPVKTK